ncbi:MAG: hypothetical protein KZQ73_04840, partial [Candidatus Thiodiazotropha sp. (ex Semelilucina semeliformis)]|nr:hypothetical protein [Candidatus Thiodiazotropha sp. (ex Semelilucina semeliformis)]
ASEGDETIAITLTNATGGAQIDLNGETVTVTITQSDQPVVTVSGGGGGGSVGPLVMAILLFYYLMVLYSRNGLIRHSKTRGRVRR